MIEVAWRIPVTEALTKGVAARIAVVGRAVAGEAWRKEQRAERHDFKGVSDVPISLTSAATANFAS